MEKECEEKKVLEQEAAEELRDEQMECVSGGQGEMEFVNPNTNQYTITIKDPNNLPHNDPKLLEHDPEYIEKSYGL